MPASAFSGACTQSKLLGFGLVTVCVTYSALACAQWQEQLRTCCIRDRSSRRWLLLQGRKCDDNGVLTFCVAFCRARSGVAAADDLLASVVMSQCEVQPGSTALPLSARREIARLPLERQSAAAWSAVQSSLAAAGSGTDDLSSAAGDTSSDTALAHDAEIASAPLPLSDPSHIVKALRTHPQQTLQPSCAAAALHVLHGLPHPACAALAGAQAGGVGSGLVAEQALATLAPLLPALRALACSVQRFESSVAPGHEAILALDALDVYMAALCGGEVVAVGSARLALPQCCCIAGVSRLIDSWVGPLGAPQTQLLPCRGRSTSHTAPITSGHACTAHLGSGCAPGCARARWASAFRVRLPVQLRPPTITRRLTEHVAISIRSPLCGHACAAASRAYRASLIRAAARRCRR
jgi:hypothetical protein